MRLDQYNPICSNGTCVMCTANEECKREYPLWEACHTEWNGDTQTKGICVHDSYNKGFEVAAIVLGSVVIFGVVLAIAVAVGLSLK